MATFARTTPLLFSSLILAFSSTARARPSLDAARLSQLAAYDVLVFADPDGSGLERGKAIGVFDATSEEVFRVATDYAKWKDYLPKVRASRVIAGGDRDALVEVTAELPWPVGSSQVEARYTQEKLAGEIFRVRFVMVRGSMKQYLGSIYVEPWSTGKAAVTYELVAEPDILAPRSAINKLVRRTASGFVHALRQRINDLHRLGFLHPIAPQTPEQQPAAPMTGDSVKAKLQR